MDDHRWLREMSGVVARLEREERYGTGIRRRLNMNDLCESIVEATEFSMNEP
jgi:hypothetical protein